DNGFGYDPLFQVPTHHCSSAELTGLVKNRISHRAKASALLQEALRRR
ncbi:MAG: non-canonical purine NTP pyrophosphatase, partial [Halieaceae bacterium]|nr:non-canonical purine NTP pyrophosphatase [Halieaceae bacterium]